MTCENRTFEKVPDAVLDYKFDWAALTNGSGVSDWLSSGEAIADITVTADAGITIDSSAKADLDTSVVVFLSGGTEQAQYEISCKIKTTDDRTDVRTLILLIVASK
ncbi:MAG: hypothetical protein DRH26_03470 [Deltaproteobacteria bacterium]|nr:MAG: hypothetical protein DRH26_03470 [Deltaproteobacteria bacterium]